MKTCKKTKNYTMKNLITIILIFLSVVVTAQTKPEMILVKGGSFSMGNPYNDKARKGEADEKPVHKVNVNDFYISKYEITVKQYKEFIADKSYKEFERYGVRHSLPPKPDSTWWQGHPDAKKYWAAQVQEWWGFKSNYPMFHVSWFDAIAYCNWLSIKTGLQPCYSINADGGIECDYSKNGYRLPTEAEWEYAARGGNKSHNYRFSGSNNFNEVAWVDDNTLLTGPRPVGTKKPNELGIYDMSGNVWEWCNDYYSSFYYSNSPEDNPVNKSPTGYRSLRGGSWHYRVEYATIYTRDGPKPGYTNYNYGFRVVRKK